MKWMIILLEVMLFASGLCLVVTIVTAHRSTANPSHPGAKPMTSSVPESAPQKVADIADALHDWLPCPHRRQALLDWVDASLARWEFMRRVRPDLYDDVTMAVLRNQYRDWIEEYSEP